jgi:predicted dehydrogenase
VYDCDNDVVDHQVVNMEFQGGLTATFTMTGFNQGGGRKTNIFGTKGEIYGDASRIELFDFLTAASTEVDLNSSDASILGGHGGGDFGLIHGFISAVATGDRSHILSGPDESLESHLMVFAAERARAECRVVEVSEA